MAVEKRKEKELKVFEELMVYQEKVFFMCLGFSRNASDAEDLTQEVYLKAYRKINSLKDLSLSKFWLFRITKNTCLDYRKKNQLRRLYPFKYEIEPMEPNTPDSQMFHRDQLRLLKRGIQQLPKKQREVFVLREYGSLSYQEIASTLKIKEGTVMSRLNRARQAIMNHLKGEQHE